MNYIPIYSQVQPKATSHGGTPYATTNVVRIPRGYSINNIDVETAKHELAHTVRHSLDGSMFHFLQDALRYWYMRQHTCSTVSNYAYAFNEGWAEYWAGSCRRSLYGGSKTNFKIEGNVANALRELQSKCSSTFRQMVQVLQDNRGKVHSFASFNSLHYAKYKCKL